MRMVAKHINIQPIKLTTLFCSHTSHKFQRGGQASGKGGAKSKYFSRAQFSGSALGQPLVLFQQHILLLLSEMLSRSQCETRQPSRSATGLSACSYMQQLLWAITQYWLSANMLHWKAILGVVSGLVSFTISIPSFIACPTKPLEAQQATLSYCKTIVSQSEFAVKHREVQCYTF